MPFFLKPKLIIKKEKVSLNQLSFFTLVVSEISRPIHTTGNPFMNIINIYM